VQHVDARADLQQLGAHVMHGADAGRAVGDLARPRLRVFDELAQVAHGQRGMRDEELRRVGDLPDGHEVAHRHDAAQPAAAARAAMVPQ
jgi:hypothetical protein